MQFSFARSILIIWYLAVDIASGSSTDYAYMGEGVVYAYALELRDTGVYGNLNSANVTFQLWP